MKDKTFLMIPGPTPVPESVLLAMAKHPIGHRSTEFSDLLKRVYEDIKMMFQTKNDVMIFTSSGTGAMESAIFNLVNPGDKVLSLIIGNFGERWAKIAEMKGAEVTKYEVAPGEAIDPEEVKRLLDADVNKEYKIVTLTHNETATGVTNDVKTIIGYIKEHGAVSVVDGITSLAALPCKMDEWGIDVLISGSQKGFMIPPGLSFLAASEKAWKLHEQCKNPSFYFNWTQNRKSVLEASTAWTPAVNLFVALDTALQMMKEEGIENIWARHKRLGTAIRAGVKAIGLKLLVKDEKYASNAITAVLPPENISVPDIRKTLKKDYDIVVANGQKTLKDKIFRIGTMGYVSERDAIAAMGALEASLYKLGYKFELGAGVAAVIKSLAENK
ncbi:MAG: alanine--glyoxylate aminotransferase family protein [Candidatus Gastranaerophilales bacterium]|nr:alanine--glyoxylate aminotransferase family protein [Candidatus Gastranaerophilales bacterium]